MDGPRKGMTRDPEDVARERNRTLSGLFGSVNYGPAVKCDNCGGSYYSGDWPFCKGDPADHLR